MLDADKYSKEDCFAQRRWKHLAWSCLIKARLIVISGAAGRITAIDSIGNGPCTTDNKVVVAIVNERFVKSVIPTVHFVV